MLKLVVLGLILAFTLLQPVRAQEWSSWRGSDRDGRVAPQTALLEWPESFATAWRADVGEGYSSPVIGDGHIFTHGRTGVREVVTAHDLTTGALVWQRDYAAAFTSNSLAPPELQGPFATPVVADDRVITLGVTGVLSSWDAASGDLQWRNSYASFISTTDLFCGTAASPLVVDDRLFVQVGSDTNGGRVLALDLASGDEVWVWDGVGPGYASPILINLDGTRQLVTLTQRSVIGLDAATGALLWSSPFEDEWHENIATPVWTGELLVVSGPRQGTHALRIRREGVGWRADKAWTNADATMYMSSPVLVGGTIFGHSTKRRGQFIVLDAGSGAVRWTSEGREGDHASILATGDRVVLLTSDAELVIFAVDATADTYSVAHHYDVADGATWAMPVLLADGLLVRDATSLTRLVPE